MKKFILMLLMLPFCAGADAQEFHVGAEGSSLVTGDYKYWQIDAIGSYTRHLYENLSFDANASLYYQHYDDEISDWDWDAGWYTGNNSSYSQTFGGSVGLNIIMHVGGPISVFSGPKVLCNFFQKAYYHGSAYDFALNRAGIQWRVGLSADVWRLRIRAAWNPWITDRGWDNKGSTVSVSVAWRL